MKKILKIAGIFLAVVILLLALSPLFLKGTMEKLAKNTIDKNINADVSWEEFDLSLFRNFPDAALTIRNFSVINRAPFEGDTLAKGSLLSINMGVTQLFKSGDNPIEVDGLLLENSLVNILIDSTGQNNYDIAIKKDAPIASETSTDDSGFTFGLKKYELKNSRINYLDESTQTFMMLKDVNHSGKGDFSLSQSELDTETTAKVTMRLGDVEYLSENDVSLNAVIQMDLDNLKYTFLENEAKINELPLTFNGFVKVNETNNEIDINFKTPSSDFKNFLAVIPKEYVKNLDGVTTTGNFTVDGLIQGVVDETHIPKLDIKIASNNASFKYPDLPKAVQNISINAQLKNDSGLLDDTYLTISSLSFKIDDELFTAHGDIRNLTGNMLVDLAMKGTLNLANIEKVLPVELDQDLSGVFKADLSAKFDMASIEKEKYENVSTNGTASLTNFNYKNAGFKNDIKISKAAITMLRGNNINLNELNATSGQTDINASGDIHNLIPFLMSKQDLRGRFKVQSNTFNLNDFMASENASEATKSKGGNANSSEAKSVKIPDFLNATIDFSAGKVIYDDLVLNNTKGTVTIKDEAATLSNVTTSTLGGDVALSGNVSTKNNTPSFTMDLDLKKIDIAQSFNQLDLLKFIAPIASALQGSLNTTLKLSGNLNGDLTPQLNSLAGNALAKILTAEVDPNKAPLLNKLGEQVPFLNINQLSLRDLSTALTFNNGYIVVKPFTFDVKGINVTAGGSHGLDKNIDYSLMLDVPAKFLGSDVTKLLAKLDPKEAETTTVSIPVGLSGTFTSPKFQLNTEAAVKSLTQKLIEKQKQELITKGTDILGDIISGNTTKPTDSTKTTTGTTSGETTSKETTTKVVTDILGGIFGNKKKKTDSTKTGN
ncbi:AsmA-like C-terminal region-containing protein [Ulvibacter antarcticus]|uniref:Uncharacterized protein involved in outer membrane biogenesis n=1 Tax=Ulvibacter antarcticus TaxID=442714 RepID=A0A3L9YBD5_9FLAO|nr:AsmA-like C-terminal region-containing protein [Ulvibacter antarcticus]RMA56660.1 uncharacterized protein involved in outer membrane biogenesis [Ulvibacter antarcticus]